MPKELRITVKATIPLPDTDSAFVEARHILAFESILEPFAASVAESNGDLEYRATVTTPRARKGDADEVPMEADVLY